HLAVTGRSGGASGIRRKESSAVVARPFLLHAPQVLLGRHMSGDETLRARLKLVDHSRGRIPRKGNDPGTVDDRSELFGYVVPETTDLHIRVGVDRHEATIDLNLGSLSSAHVVQEGRRRIRILGLGRDREGNTGS